MKTYTYILFLSFISLKSEINDLGKSIPTLQEIVNSNASNNPTASNNITEFNDIIVDTVKITRDLNIIGDETVGGTLAVTGISTLTGAVTASAGLTATAGDIVATAGNITATIGNLSIGGTSTLTGAVSAPAGITGDLTGNVTGSIIGNITGDVTGNLTGSISGGTLAGSTLSTSGLATLNSASITTTLGVTGASTLAALSQIGTANINTSGTLLTTIGNTAGDTGSNRARMIANPSNGTIDFTVGDGTSSAASKFANFKINSMGLNTILSTYAAGGIAEITTNTTDVNIQGVTKNVNINTSASTGAINIGTGSNNAGITLGNASNLGSSVNLNCGANGSITSTGRTNINNSGGAYTFIGGGTNSGQVQIGNFTNNSAVNIESSSQVFIKSGVIYLNSNSVPNTQVVIGHANDSTSPVNINGRIIMNQGNSDPIYIGGISYGGTVQIGDTSTNTSNVSIVAGSSGRVLLSGTLLSVAAVTSNFGSTVNFNGVTNINSTLNVNTSSNANTNIGTGSNSGIIDIGNSFFTTNRSEITLTPGTTGIVAIKVGNGTLTDAQSKFTINGQNITVIASSRKFKTKIETVNNVEDIHKLDIVKFEYKNNPNELQYGFIIEDMIEKGIFKDFITYDKDENPEGLRLNMIFVAAVKALQDLKKEFDLLKKDYEILKFEMQKE